MKHLVLFWYLSCKEDGNKIHFLPRKVPRKPLTSASDRLLVNCLWFYLQSLDCGLAYRDQGHGLNICSEIMPHQRVFVQHTDYWHVLIVFREMMSVLNAPPFPDQLDPLQHLTEALVTSCRSRRSLPESLVIYRGYF